MKDYFARQPWFILARHFLERYFDTEVDTGELRTGVPALLGFAAAPGLVACALLFDKYSTLRGWFMGVFTLDRDLETLPDKYIFLTLAFVISGLATVFKWDSLFPDRKDYMILAPLPLSPMAIFASKFAALVLFVVVFATAVNIAGTIFFPAVVLGNTGTASTMLRYLVSHITATMAASLAGSLLVIATAGFLLNVLPAAAMRRASSWLQFGFLVLFLTQLFLAPQVAYKLFEFYEGPEWRLLLFPPMWFVGLYEQILGRSSMDLSRWADWSRSALLISAALSCVFYLASYFRHFSRTGETSDAGVAPSRTWRLIPLPKDAREAAVVDFVKQTISRSGVHRIVLRVFLGLACAVIVQQLIGEFIVGLPKSRGVAPMALSSPLVVSFFLLVGLRLLLEIPADRQAAWAFHIALDETATQPVLRGVRRVLFEIGVVAWIIVIAPVNIVLLGAAVGIAHTIFCLVVSLLFLDGLLFTYQKIPFTCSMSEDRTYLGLAFAAWVAVFLVYAYVVTIIETSLLQGVARFVIALCVLFGVWMYLQVRKRNWATLNTKLDLKGGTPPVVMTLDLQP
jgi:hypothetical protein